MKAFLVLENGAYFEGKSFGADSSNVGEVVFNTSLSGYQEILTDPSYNSQIVTLTYPMIGNYGINPEDMESEKIQVSGLIVKEYNDIPSNFRSKETLSAFLKRYNIPGIQGLDTRMLTRFIRNNGSPRGGIFIGEEYSEDFLKKVLAFPGLKGAALVANVSTKKEYTYTRNPKDKKYSVAVYDFGVKLNILRKLESVGFQVHVFPSDTPADSIVGRFDAFFLSNGPGDPEPLVTAAENTKKILFSGKPLFGICLGHQILGIAMGRKTYKLKFGHRGGNQPVKNHISGKVEITSQNHGFAVQPDPSETRITHTNLNDDTIEGFRLSGTPVFSVQYHPESSPGPHDSEYLFTEFYQAVDSYYTKLGEKR